MRGRAILAVLALMLAACQPPAAQDPAAEAQADLARECVGAPAQRRIEACTSLIDMPDVGAELRADYYVFRGDAYRSLGQVTAALRDFEAALRLDGQHARAQLGRGEILLASGQLDAAEPILERLAPGDESGRAALGLARIAWLRRDSVAALNHLTAALERNPNSAEAYAVRAAVRKAGGDMDGAREDFSAAIRMDGALAEARAGRCRLNLEAGANLDQARDDAEAAALADPRNVAGQVCRGILQLRAQQPGDALAAFSAALEVEPGNPEALFGHGIARMRTGDSQGARDMNRARDFNSHIGQRYEQLGVGTR